MQYYGSSENVPALKWGREKEDEARQDYISHMSVKHVDFVVRPCGLVVDPKYPYLGASPDGFVSCSCCGCGLLEIKCPFKFRDHSPTAEELLSDPSYCLKRITIGEIHLSVSHKYYCQVQGQIVMCDSKHCDFVCWTTKGIFIDRIGRDDHFISDILPDLKLFFTNYVLPELLSHNLESDPAACKKDEKLYCVCRQPESDRMIACDNPTCSIEWFHFQCVGLKRAPHGKWYCSNCGHC